MTQASIITHQLKAKLIFSFLLKLQNILNI